MSVQSRRPRFAVATNFSLQSVWITGGNGGLPSPVDGLAATGKRASAGGTGSIHCDL